jgi:peptidoglycan/xylan/chitin deacetylase (PgdA/CDA1 family)
MFRSLALLLGWVIVASAQEKVLYLTFDDGPQRGTAEVLDVLRRSRCRPHFSSLGATH